MDVASMPPQQINQLYQGIVEASVRNSLHQHRTPTSSLSFWLVDSPSVYFGILFVSLPFFHFVLVVCFSRDRSVQMSPARGRCTEPPRHVPTVDSLDVCTGLGRLDCCKETTLCVYL